MEQHNKSVGARERVERYHERVTAEDKARSVNESKTILALVNEPAM